MRITELVLRITAVEDHVITAIDIAEPILESREHAVRLARSLPGNGGLAMNPDLEKGLRALRTSAPYAHPCAGLDLGSITTGQQILVIILWISVDSQRNLGDDVVQRRTPPDAKHRDWVADGWNETIRVRKDERR